MNKKAPDWLLQSIWFIAGIFATGALWYFISIKNTAFSVASAVATLIFVAVAVFLHRRRDHQEAVAATKEDNEKRLHGEIALNVGEERVTFTEFIRSAEYDIVKVNANQHFLGVASEHEWIHTRYPEATMGRQTLTTLDRLKLAETAESESEKIRFDVIDLTFPDGRNKKVYFDISSFFNELTYEKIDPESRVAHKLNEIYR
ncbi:hypothetical protein OKW41_002756 [Paraburkholderia sp. UCT70]|uniref:hypothetical protein n=1 Tax=Paraburkholderia sp. UCT70 TaxID=2991068 RepID=UPI003D1A31CA